MDAQDRAFWKSVTTVTRLRYEKTDFVKFYKIPGFLKLANSTIII